MAGQGAHPYELPVGVDYGVDGACLLCATCDGFPCQVDAKNDAEMKAVRPALKSPRVTAAVGARDGRPVEIRAHRFVVAAGAALSAALLLKSGTSQHRTGLGNSSGLVGRHYMQHVFSAILAIDPRHRTKTGFQKTAALNDFYLTSRYGYPLGNIQGLGKLHPEMLKASKPWAPLPLLRFMSEHGTDWWATTEDLPDPDNRITVSSTGQIVLTYSKNNVIAHRRLVKEAKRLLRQAGFPLVFASELPINATAAQCGTLRFGEDPTTSVLDPNCRMHDIDNVWVVDASFMPSSAAQNPGLTIAANALRVGETGGIAD
jgi:choline dehydrogenase-like flavoprotein